MKRNYLNEWYNKLEESTNTSFLTEALPPTLIKLIRENGHHSYYGNEPQPSYRTDPTKIWDYNNATYKELSKEEALEKFDELEDTSSIFIIAPDFFDAHYELEFPYNYGLYVFKDKDNLDLEKSFNAEYVGADGYNYRTVIDKALKIYQIDNLEPFSTTNPEKAQQRFSSQADREHNIKLGSERDYNHLSWYREQERNDVIDDIKAQEAAYRKGEISKDEYSRTIRKLNQRLRKYDSDYQNLRNMKSQLTYHWSEEKLRQKIIEFENINREAERLISDVTHILVHSIKLRQYAGKKVYGNSLLKIEDLLDKLNVAQKELNEIEIVSGGSQYVEEPLSDIQSELDNSEAALKALQKRMNDFLERIVV